MRISLLLPLSLSILCSAGDRGSVTVAVTDSALSRVGGQQLFHGTPFSGTLLSYHPDGRIARETQYRRGRQDGSDRSWFEDGRPQSDRAYRGGIKVGRHRTWWPNGQLCTDATFVTGVYDGPVRAYWSTGQPSELRHYDHGQEVGRQQSFALDGRPLANFIVRDGRRYGLLGAQLCFTVHGGPS